eukprot:gene54984-55069_t
MRALTLTLALGAHSSGDDGDLGGEIADAMHKGGGSKAEKMLEKLVKADGHVDRIDGGGG